MKLTAKGIRGLDLPKGKSDHLFWDDDIPGFGLRLRAGGSRSWVFQYALGDKQRRLSLGAATPESFTKQRTLDGVIKLGIREQAALLHASVKLGQDPAGEKQQARETATDTFKAVAERYLEFQEKLGGKDGKGLRLGSHRELKRHLMMHAKTLHSLLFAKIQQRDIANVISAVRAKHAVTANRVRTSLASLYSWAIGEGLISINPVTGTKRTEEKSRDRVLDPAELRAIWNSLSDDHFGSIMKLLALTGQRAGEIAGLRWSEINEDRGSADLPPERIKNGRKHSIPLSEPARAIIAAQPRRPRSKTDSELRDLIFGFGDGPFSGWGKSMELLNKRIVDKAGYEVPHFTPHDLRRSVATYLGGGLPEDRLNKLPPRDREFAAGLGEPPHVIESILNHVSGFKAGVAGICNRSDYGPEERRALALWADRLIAIVENRESNIKPLKRAAG